MSVEDHKIKYYQALKPVAEDLRKVGFEINEGDFTHLQAKDGSVLSLEEMSAAQEKDDLQYLNRKYRPLPLEAVNVLLKWIPKIDYPPAQEVLISQLSRTKVKYDGDALLDTFKHSDSSLVRERIGFVLEESNPEVDKKELESILLDPKYEKQIVTLLLAGIKFLPKEKIFPILISRFDQFPLIVLGGFKKLGGREELAFLKTRLSAGKLDKRTQKEIEKTIEKIGKRANEQNK